jgi:hypothetical protein
MTSLTLRHANFSRSSGQWQDEGYDGGRLWMWASGHNGDYRRTTQGYEPTREDAMEAFAKSWHRDT